MKTNTFKTLRMNPSFSSIYLFNKDLLNTYNISGTVLGYEDTIVFIQIGRDSQ